MAQDKIQHKHLDLNLLKVFEALMLERSTSRAAERLGRTQSAVSHALNRLRSTLNDELFTRSMGEMLPTPLAMELASEVLPALQAIYAKIEQGNGFDPARATREFVIGVTDYTAVGLCSRVLQRVAQEAPGTSLRFVHAGDRQTEELLLRREADLAVLGNTSVHNTDLICAQVDSDRNICLGWSGNALMQPPLTLEGYLAARHLQVSIEGLSYGMADRALDRLGLKREIQAFIPHYTMAPRVIQGTDLLVIVGERVFLELSPEDDVLAQLPPLEIPEVTISLIYRKTSLEDPAHQWLRGVIERCLDELHHAIRKTMPGFLAPPDAA